MPKWLRDVIVGTIASLIVFGIAYYFDAKAEDRQERLENLRFVRERSSPDKDQPRPFRGLDLEGQNLSGLRLEKAQLVGANLHGADLRFAFLKSVQFHKVDLRGAQLTQTSLGQALFIDAQLNGAFVNQAFAQGAKFEGSDVAGADFTGTALYGADLSTALNLTEANVSGICWDGSTLWPAGFTPPPSAPPDTCPKATDG
jgi:uncharacterized protein YjbI with pentapeptide repeats